MIKFADGEGIGIWNGVLEEFGPVPDIDITRIKVFAEEVNQRLMAAVEERREWKKEKMEAIYKGQEVLADISFSGRLVPSPVPRMQTISKGRSVCLCPLVPMHPVKMHYSIQELVVRRGQQWESDDDDGVIRYDSTQPDDPDASPYITG